MLSGREGKMFHPLAFTKSFAMIGVAIISITLVPALIPTFIKGRLRSEEENWIVRSFIDIYKPLLTWALPRRNLVMWMFAVLLDPGGRPVSAAGDRRPGASETPGETAFLACLRRGDVLTVIFTRGCDWQVLSFVSLVLLGLWAYHFPKIGVAFMPALDEGTTLDMPVTVPRASVTQAADDLKARDALLRGFPEVESVIGKAGRADTPTDPAPLDMVETFVNFRPKELWPKRVLKYRRCRHRQTRSRAATLSKRTGYVQPTPDDDDRDNLINDATQKALERFDEMMRELALLRYKEFEHELGPLLTRFAVDETIRLHGTRAAACAGRTESTSRPRSTRLSQELVAEVRRLAGQASGAGRRDRSLARTSPIGSGDAWESSTIWSAALGTARVARCSRVVTAVREVLGGRAQDVLRRTCCKRSKRSGRGSGASASSRSIGSCSTAASRPSTAYALEELVKAAGKAGLIGRCEHADASRERFAAGSRSSRNWAKTFDDGRFRAVQRTSRRTWTRPFAKRVFFWPRQTGPKGDLVDDEMGRVLQVPAGATSSRSRSSTASKCSRPACAPTSASRSSAPTWTRSTASARTIEAALKPINGARDVIAAPIMGKGYLQIDIDREQAARYGISVEDIQNEIEVALAGRAVTYTVEKRDRFPVRIRYARASREDEESIRRLLISAGGMATQSAWRRRAA